VIGNVVGDYKILTQLGAGGMGTVWLAEHALIGKRVAIKVLQAELSQQQHIVQRFFDEARAATRIADPGIVAVLDFGWHTDGSAYLVMEHLIGETLGHRIAQRGRIDADTTLRVLHQCAIAMSAAHQAGIVHRDLKPDNVFLARDPAMPGGERVKILDFGIAKLLGDEPSSHGRTQTGIIMGTPAYMSPEQCRGAGGVDHRTDIYALGCVAFHITVGRPPFDAPTPGDLIACHLTQPVPVPSASVPGLPPRIDAIITRCLAKRADDRFATMAELAAVADPSAAWAAPTPAPQPSIVDRDATLATRSPVAPSPTTLRGSAGETIEPQTQRWRGGAIVAAVVVVAAVALTIVLATKSDRSPRSSNDSTTTPVDASTAPTATPTAVDAAVAPPKDAPSSTASPPRNADVDARPRRPRRPDADPLDFR
jgi:serine/threonine-protein kinase